jgi:hypothetical protein
METITTIDSIEGAPAAGEKLSGRRAARIFAFWFCMAFGVGEAQLLQKMPAQAIGAIVWSLTAAVLLAYWKLSRFRNWVLALDIRHLILLHVTRFVGIYFLVLYGRGELPYAFAVPGGWGDITVAATAILAIAAAGRPTLRTGAVMIWNTIGLIDILFVVMTAMRLALTEPGSMNGLMRLPLSLLPTFLVPLIIASHVVIFARLSRPAGIGGGRLGYDRAVTER